MSLLTSLTGGVYTLRPCTTYQIVAKSVMPPNIEQFQFIVCKFGFAAVGKKQKMKNGTRKIWTS